MDGNTTVSIALIISICSVAMTFMSFRRNTKNDTEQAIESRIKMNVKLDQLCATTNEIRVDTRSTIERINTLDARVTKVEASTKSAHYRLDEHLDIEKDTEKGEQ